MQKKILVPADFSEHAFLGAKHAITIARAKSLAILLLHVYSTHRSNFQSDLANETDQQRARLGAIKNMQQFLKSLSNAGYSDMEFELFNGSIADGLKHCQASNEINLVVMGTKRRTGLEATLSGCNTFELASHASVPLLIVPAAVQTFLFDRPLLFSDFQSGDKQTLVKFSHLFLKRRNKCQLVHISSGDHDQLSKERSKLEKYAKELEAFTPSLVMCSEMVGGKDRVDTANKAIELYDANIALITIIKRTDFFERALNKSFAKAVMMNPSIPVLLVAADEGHLDQQ